MERKLAAIFSTDVKGYSRLMGEDEEATIRTLKTYREIISRLIEQHHGRVVDSPGDNLLAEFASAVEAVQGAVAIQQELKARNAELPATRKMEYRIGLNVGDVVVEGERLYGEGVNIAARLESLAEGGGISISGTVYDQVKTKLALGYEYLGEQAVKNIAEPVRVYKVQRDPGAGATPTVRAVHPAPSPGAEKVTPRRWRMAALAAVAVLVVYAGVAVFRNVYQQPPTSPAPVSFEETPALPFPDKSSIAVLPFTNLSGDPEQEYFSDGMTEDLITDLSKISSLFVIARHSVFTYKGQAVNIEDVGRELGVRYVLEGSTRKAGNRVRINAQLVDATTGGHLWAERYDRELRDIFVLQDEITREIVTALEVKLTKGEHASVSRRHTNNLAAYDDYLRGRAYYFRFTKGTNVQARQMLERASERDPAFAAAYVWLAATYLIEGVMQWSQDPQLLERAGEFTQRGLALDDSLPDAHIALGQLYLRRDRQHERAIAEGEKAIALDPNYAPAYEALAEMLNFAGRPEEALGMTEKAMRLDPHYQPIYVHYVHILGWTYRLMGRYEEAIPALKKALTLNPDFWPSHLNLALIYNELGREEEARAEAVEVLRINPNYSLEVWKQSTPYKDPAVLERLVAALRKAGLE